MVRISRDIFREYDIRGVAGQQLTPLTARIIARAFAEWLDERQSRSAGGAGGGGKAGAGSKAGVDRGTGAAGGPGERTVALGRDNRLSSPALAAGLARGFADAGWEVVDLGVVPTPVFYFSRVRYDLDAGVMVTGSHNEAKFNGFKMASGPATIYGQDIQEVGRRAERIAGEIEESGAPDTAAETEGAGGGSGALGAAGAHGTDDARGTADVSEFATRRIDPLADYLLDLKGRVRFPERRRRPLRVAVDCGSGAASLVAPGLFAELGCEVFPIYCELDGTFPGHWPDPVKPENLVELQRVVKEERADLGVAFDGDADRIGVVDDQGEILWGDVLMILFWREILARNPGARAIIEVKCSQGLVDEVRRLGGEPLFYRTGHSLIKAKMREIGALFAGEMSGHMFFADEYYGFDDAIYAAARLMRILAAEDRPLSELLADRPRYFSTPETRVECPDRTKFRVVDEVRRHFKDKGLEVIDVDGARVNFPGGWLLVRASNTQPALVVRCEGRTPEALEELKAATVEALRELEDEAGLTLPEW